MILLIFERMYMLKIQILFLNCIEIFSEMKFSIWPYQFYILNSNEVFATSTVSI
jgi:hypothetical protein